MYTLCKCLRQSEIISNRQNSYSRKHKHIMKVQCIRMWLFIVVNTDATFLMSKHVLLMLVYTHSVVFGERNWTWKSPTCVASWSILSKHVLLDLLYIHVYSVVFGGRNRTWKSPTCFASWGNCVMLLLAWFPGCFQNEVRLPLARDVYRLEGDVPVCMRPLTTLYWFAKAATYTCSMRRTLCN